MNKVAIIGAGASGLISAKIFQDNGFRVKVFEKTSNIGGIWNYHESQGVLYKSLKTNLPKEIMSFDNEKVSYKANNISFVSHKDVLLYLKENAQEWKITDKICLNTEVIKLEPINKSLTKPLWKIVYINNGNIFYEEFDFIIIANGHYHKPKLPHNVPGFNDIIKNSIHSKYYRRAKNHANKVLCVGYSSSGIDISKELYNSGKEVFVSIRDLDKKQEILNIQNSQGIKFISTIIKYKYSKEDNKCIAITKNGNSLKVDEIIFCTGYFYDFPFLSPKIITTENNIIKPLYSHILHQKYINLAFVGIPWKTVPFILSECQAIFLANMWKASDSHLNNIIKKLIDLHNSFKHAEQPLKNYHMLEKEQWIYNLSLLDIVNKKTKEPEKRINLIEKIYIDLQQLKNKKPDNYRDFIYKVDWDKYFYKKFSP
ncbi:MAG: NAD(P)/FAD-dependent oxidoreductase [Francisella sp.]